MRRMAGLLVLAMCAALCSAAQDLRQAAPQFVKVEYEDARVRVVRLRIPPNASLPVHDRPARVVIPLTTSVVRMNRADGSAANVRSVAGTAIWSGPGRRSFTNLDAPLENIIVEVKNAKEPAKPLAQPPMPHPAGYLDEPFHHWLFENQYVRVYDVHVPAGATTAFHEHAFDTVFVEISGGLEAAQSQGGAWEKPRKTIAGEVAFSPDAAHHRVHRVRNEGASEYHVIAVQLLP